MTPSAAAQPAARPAGGCGCGQPAATTVVLLHRSLPPEVNPDRLSVFGEDRWDLTAGIFEPHTTSIGVNFAACPARLLPAAKRYLWELVNHAAPHTLRAANTDRLSLHSVSHAWSGLLPFLTWLDVHDIDSFDQITPADLDRFLDDLLNSESGRRKKACCLIEVRRLWCYRSRLPEPMRLPATPPWNGDNTRDLLDTPHVDRENATPRIHPDTLQPLLMWSLRFVEDFAEDVLAAFADYQRLMRRGADSRHRLPADQRAAPDDPGRLIDLVHTYLAQLQERGGALPGRVRDDGIPEIHWQHLGRVLDCPESAWLRRSSTRELIARVGLPIAQDAYLDAPITGLLHGQPWRATPISYTEAPRLARLLSAACAVTILYLSGMRPGELLSLQRDCIDHDPVTNLWFLRGRQWKGAVGPDGQKLPEGSPRTDPWTVIQPVARAVDVLHRLHPHSLLFPAQLRHDGTVLGPDRRARPITGRSSRAAGEAIADLISWVNDYCRGQGYDTERIPADPRGPISLSRFRRTLAWHIVRRPRGLVAGAIQYAHLHVRITLGYSGSYDSGFPDDHAYEDWLYRLEQLADREERLAGGEHVSGPAADVYRHRVHTGHHTFAGRVLTSARQARDLLDNELLHVFPGRAMTCVLNPQQALCQIMTAEGDTRRTPDQDDCRPQCRNLAYTDENIAELHTRARRLREVIADPLAPSIRRGREQRELDRITTLIRRHEQGR